MLKFKTIKTAAYGKIVINLKEVNCRLGQYMLEVVYIGGGSSMCFIDDEYRADLVFRNTATYHRVTRGKRLYSGIQQHRIMGEVGELIDKERQANYDRLVA